MTKIGKLKKHELKSNRRSKKIHEPFFLFFFEYIYFKISTQVIIFQVTTTNIFTCKQMFDVLP